MNPEPEDVNQNFDHEIPCYVYGYYNGEESIMDEDDIVRLRNRHNNHIGSMPEKYKTKKDTAETVKDFKTRMCDKKLAKAGFPCREELVNRPLLIEVGDGGFIFEALITEISESGKAFFIEPTHNPLGRTITEKMVGWWRLEKIKLVDKINVKKSKVKEKDMTRSIL